MEKGWRRRSGVIWMGGIEEMSQRRDEQRNTAEEKGEGGSRDPHSKRKG